MGISWMETTFVLEAQSLKFISIHYLSLASQVIQEAG